MLPFLVGFLLLFRFCFGVYSNAFEPKSAVILLRDLRAYFELFLVVFEDV